MASASRIDRAALIREHTVRAHPRLCPEIQLHLITDACPLWRAGERDLDALAMEPPFWAFAWPGGQALARYLLDHPGEVAGRRVLDVGAGGAVEGIAAAMRGAAHVCAADLDPLACAAARLNAELNGVALEAQALDVFAARPTGYDVILAGDVCYDRQMARELLAWLSEEAARGTRVLLSDPNRGFLPDPAPLRLVTEYDAPSDGDVDGSSLRRTAVFELTP